MEFISGFKHQLHKDEVFDVPFYPEGGIITEFVRLTSKGHLTLKKGFAWDGATFIIDRKTNLRASAAHDALYRLMRKKLLNHNHWRIADGVFRQCLKEDGAWVITIKADMAGLYIARGSAAHPKNRIKIRTAP